jgi:hypothetical protein
MLVDDIQAAFIRRRIESVRDRWANECSGKPWGRFLHDLKNLLTDRDERKPGHEAWEWWAKHPARIERLEILGKGVSWRCGCATTWEDSPLAAVLAAMAAEAKGGGRRPLGWSSADTGRMIWGEAAAEAAKEKGP